VGRPAQQLAGRPQLAELAHRDFAQRERRRIFPQGEPIERAADLRPAARVRPP
jgi:hypothetical protein